MSIRIINQPRDTYLGKLTEREAAHAVNTLSHTGLKAWVLCAAHYNGYLWKHADLSPEEITELSSKGFLKRGDGIQEDWIFDSAGEFEVKAHTSSPSTSKQRIQEDNRWTDEPWAHENNSTPPSFSELADADDDIPF